MPELKFYLLGSPRIEYQGELIKLERRKALALLAYLAVTGKPCNRDYMATLLWSEYNEKSARASLRRILTVIKKTPIDAYLGVDRQNIWLKHSDDLWIDIQQLQDIQDDILDVESLEAIINLYQSGFMSGFSLKDSLTFDSWQSLQAQTFQQVLLEKIDQIVHRLIDFNEMDQAIKFLRYSIAIDPLNDTAQRQVIRLYAISGQRSAALKQYETYCKLLEQELGVEPHEETQRLYEAIKSDNVDNILTAKRIILGNLPPTPALVIGRENAIEEVKARLGITNERVDFTTIVIQGWPGIGKTTLSSLIAHDREIHEVFPDGVLWTSLGDKPNLLAEMLTWARALNLSDASESTSIEDLSTRLSAILRDKRMLIIIDDAWEAGHASPFKIGGRRCATLITTRMNHVAHGLANRPEDIYKLPILSTDAALHLLRTLAPQVVENKPAESVELVNDLEGLPLAIQVAGRLLRAEMSMGWDISDLIQELREGTRLLNAQAPADRIDLANETTPTVAVLLQRSTQHLDATTRERFALLGVFAPKPATFDQNAIAAVWAIDDPRATIRILVDRGLLEPIGSGRFQIHALLVMLAKSMF
ncbi:MAG: hypothetical protein D6711_18380, partial [Chloroflexi bacterium]